MGASKAAIPALIALCDAAGLDYGPCSPYRVPIARLAATRAALDAREDCTA
jgi:pyruvate,orthophosphate dikinase